MIKCYIEVWKRLLLWYKTKSLKRLKKQNGGSRWLADLFAVNSDQLDRLIKDNYNNK